MGNCINSKIQRNGVPSKNDQDTSQIPPHNSQSLPLLNFKSLLTDFKLKRCKFYEQVGITVKFGRVSAFDLDYKSLSQQIARWDIKKQVSFKMTQYGMHKQFLQLTFTDIDKKIIGLLRINLYLLAVGPYHQDFSLNLQQSPGARISFNAKISQEVSFKLQVNDVELISTNKECQNNFIAFNLRSIIGGIVEESELSYQQIKPCIHTNFKDETMACKQSNQTFGPDLSKESSIEVNESDEMKIFWSNTATGQLPLLQSSVYWFDFEQASFSLVFYQINNKIKTFSSQCFISINQLTSSKHYDHSLLDSREVVMRIRTLNSQKQRGWVTIKATLSVSRHLKQMHLCVRTENGILQSSPIIKNQDSERALVAPNQIMQLEKLDQEVQNSFIEAYNANNSVKSGWVYQLRKKLIRQKELLQCTDKQSKCVFVYNNSEALLNSQRVLIGLGNRVMNLISEQIEEITPKCWQLLISIIKRAELNLTYIGFTKEEVQMCINKKETSFLKKKKQIAEKYHHLLIAMLQRTLKSLEGYDCESQRQFSELFCAFAYFRLPKFREVVLAAITREDDPEISEWRGTEFALTEGEETSASADQQTSFKLMFDWENHFYRVIEKQESYSKEISKLAQIFERHSWEKTIKKRERTYLSLVSYWIKYIETIVVNANHLKWRYFPGYKKILLSFLAEMKIKQIANYSPLMKKAAISLLSNQKLLNPFVLILFRKTNQFDQTTSARTFDLISIFLKSIEDRHRKLPNNFDLKLLMEGMLKILQGEAIIPKGKVLLLYYDHYRLFPLEFRQKLNKQLMSTLFFELFLHWSHSVRTIFHYLLLVRIYYQYLKPFTKILCKESSKSSSMRRSTGRNYFNLMRMLENIAFIQCQSKKLIILKDQDYKSKLNSKIVSRVQRTKKIRSQGQIRIQETNDLKFSKQWIEQVKGCSLADYKWNRIADSLREAIDKKTALEQIDSSESTLQNKSVMIDLKQTQPSFPGDQFILKPCQLAYLPRALSQYECINKMFKESIERDTRTIPAIGFEISLDEKEVKPRALQSVQEE